MHPCKNNIIAGAKARAVAAVGAFLLCGVLALVPVAAEAGPSAPSETPAGVRVLLDPVLPDGPLGWRRSPTTVSLLPLRPGTLYYSWDSPLGPWHRPTGTMTVPEGKHRLFTMLVVANGPDLAPPEYGVNEIKVDYRLRAPSRTALAASFAGGTGQVTAVARILPHAGARLIRLGGRDRYETAALISAQNYASADTVIIATGATFADALSASGLAGCTESPILLTRPGSLPAAARAEIQRLGASTAIIVGGTGAVAPAVASTLSTLGLTVDRIGGKDRYETATLIGTRILSFGQSGGRVFIARGDDFADALSLGPLSHAARAPLILVKPTAVPPATRSFVSAHRFSSGCLAGGTAAVSSGVEAQLRASINPLVRLAGETRYSTSVAVAAWGASAGLVDLNTVGIATGTVFADALCGGVAAGSRGGVVFLTRPGSLSREAGDAISLSVGAIRELQVYGGEGAVQPLVLTQISNITR